MILGSPTLATAALQRESRSIPIVFAIVADPVGVGFVASLAWPGGNLTGFTAADIEPGKQLNLLREVAPSIKRAAIMFNPDTAPRGGDYFLGSFKAATRYQALESVAVRVRSAAEIEAAILSLGRQQAGLLLAGDPFVGGLRKYDYFFHAQQQATGDLPG